MKRPAANSMFTLCLVTASSLLKFPLYKKQGDFSLAGFLEQGSCFL